MQFIQIGMLSALGALAIPIIIHLMFRARARPVDLGTLQFLKVVLRDNARRRRLKRWLLLALRMGVLASIAFLFARPYMLATEPAPGDRLTVVLLDRSASMGQQGGPRPIDQALAEARTIVARAGEGARLEVATFGETVQPIVKPTDLATAAIEPAPSGTDYGAAMAWARDMLTRSRTGGKELHILTDLQRSGLDRGESVSLPEGVEVTLRDFGRAFPRNVAVTGVTIKPQALRPGETATVTATVFNASPVSVAKCRCAAARRGRWRETRARAGDRPGRLCDGHGCVSARSAWPRGSGWGTSRPRPAMNYHLMIVASWRSGCTPGPGADR